ncbi:MULTISPECIES: flagellar filament capping protein FliD [Cellulomonas]|jgi:flagellar hook-associated protein 2|uniref:Flagellar hook-associated protein 2 n=1 Tax=Cellulomonas iranensis TaxID=76862 RepID=A0ABU0GH65_9CELL|nr:MULTISPECIES: flagellar filament capping protein FliD [Cellulomonas]MDQ0424699.1 flagellar hook-associated protein 2 [Cellulomonas iranensis]TFH70114.1 acyl-CoA desaturase [Cellulomonas sp. HD19AZ1]
MAAIDGLVSGIKTGEYIDSLITLQSGQQSLLVQKKSTASALVTALQALNTKVASLAEHAAKAAKPESWNAVKAAVTQPGTSGTPGASATVSAGAQLGTLTFRVDAVAQSQASLVALPTTFASEKPSFTITRGGETVTVTADSTSVPDIVEAFNGAGTGVRATAVKVDKLDVDGNPTGESTYRLQVTGTETGGRNAFTIAHDGGNLALDTVREARDAAITLFPGTPGAQRLTSPTNTITGVLTGVDLTVTAETAADAKPLTLDLTRDDSTVKSLASGLVANLNVVLSEIASRTKSTTSTSEDGRTVVSGGLFAGDAGVRMLQQNMLALGSMPVDGVSPADVGIVIQKDGTFTFDDAVYTAAAAKDPDKVAAVVQGVAARLSEAAKTASDSKEGTITTAITGHQDAVKDLTERITAWDERLAARRVGLERMYASLEKTLARMNSQASYLSSYLANDQKQS